MKIAKPRATLLAMALGALVANSTFAQAGAGSGGGGAPSIEAKELFLDYTKAGGIAGIRYDVTVFADGAVQYAETHRGMTKRGAGQLEDEELAGLAAALDRVFRFGVLNPPPVGPDGFDRSLVAMRNGSPMARTGNTRDAATQDLVEWLDDIAELVKSGHLDDANKLFEAKLARPDRGGLAASGVIVTRGVTAPVPVVGPAEVRYEIDKNGRRSITGIRPLLPREQQAVYAMIELGLVTDEPPHSGGDAAELFVLRLWDRMDALARRDVHPFAETIVGLPADVILAWLLVS